MRHTPLGPFVLVTLLTGVAAQEKTFTFAGSTERVATRLAVFAAQGHAFTALCQACIEYEAPEWKDEYDQQLDRAKGQRLRLGKNFWTTLDNNVEVSIGNTKVPAGQWYLGLACTEAGKWSLMVMNAQSVRELRLDAFQTAQLTAKISAPLTYAKGDKSVAKLSIEIAKDEQQDGAGTLVLAWGTHKLSAPFALDVAAARTAAAAKGAGDPVAKAKVDVSAIDGAIRTFFVTNRAVPKMEQLTTPDARGQAYLTGFEGVTPCDPWGNAYVIVAGEKKGTWEVLSLGPDKLQGTADDISSLRMR